MVTLTAIVFAITYIPMTFVAIYMFREFTPSLTFRFAIVIVVIGGWIRFLGNDQFWVILVGYIIISLSFPILLSSTTMLCNVWLGDKERLMWI
jgi:hypothetical protein